MAFLFVGMLNPNGELYDTVLMWLSRYSGDPQRSSKFALFLPPAYCLDGSVCRHPFIGLDHESNSFAYRNAFHIRR